MSIIPWVLPGRHLWNQILDPTQSTLNLRVSSRYPWGALPVYVARGGAMVADYFVSIFKPQLKGYYLRDFHGAQLVGRTMASIFDLITVLLVFLIACRLYSTRTALIATALVAFSVTNIQIAHFYITEPFLVTFMMASLYFTVVLMQRPSWWAAVGAGAFLRFFGCHKGIERAHFRDDPCRYTAACRLSETNA